ncbi:T-cell-interacting, activating receptor on myeloid cells protein 1-like isoform X3 [Suricata suricatta]|uniref:T-cell-interacting, activating receptor on myeloid cells protein 1-like isoform X3 n=1 Tax=Suricata suricatta TaxID=37032 RepID=UPI0011558B18|nr:T-cell-interacting, activating receptor on myeloid cells protein 1-like isoform X3 [Suricata suricatta]
MTPQLLTLLCTGLCTGQGGREPDEPLPKPSLRAWPSSVAPPRSNVTLQCRSPTKDVHFTLRKGNIPLPFAQPPASTEGLAEFLLTDLRTSQAGKYTCEVHRGGLPSMKSPPSDAVLLLVTGDFSKPSLQAHRRGVVTAGDNVTLQCQRPGYDFRRVMFALLKAGEAAPIQTQVSVGKTDFSLWTVTAGDSGNYSCVYFQTEAPFWASEPSDPLEVRVRDSTERKSPEGAETGLGATGVILAVVCSLLTLLGALLVCKHAQRRRRRGAALSKMAERSCSPKESEKLGTSNQPGKESGGTPAATLSCPPASVPRSRQPSRGED